MPAALSRRLQILTALSYPGYRWFCMGTVASVMGTQVLNASQGWLVYQLTGPRSPSA